MEHKATRYSVDAAIATITLHRPERMNAWTGRMHAEYRYCLDLAERDSAVRAIVVTGAGRGFCVGGDAAALQGHVEKGGYDPGTPATLANPGFGTCRRIRRELRLSLRFVEAGDRRDQRSRGRGRVLRSRVLQICALRRRGSR